MITLTTMAAITPASKPVVEVLVYDGISQKADSVVEVVEVVVVVDLVVEVVVVLVVVVEVVVDVDVVKTIEAVKNEETSSTRDSRQIISVFDVHKPVINKEIDSVEK